MTATHSKNNHGDELEEEVSDIVLSHFDRLGIQPIVLKRTKRKPHSSKNDRGVRLVKLNGGEWVSLESLKNSHWFRPLLVEQEPYVHAKNKSTGDFCKHDNHLYLPASLSSPNKAYYYHGLWEVKNQDVGGSNDEKIWDGFGAQIQRGYYWAPTAALLLGGEEFSSMPMGDLRNQIQRYVQDARIANNHPRGENRYVPQSVDVTNSIEEYIESIFEGWENSLTEEDLEMFRSGLKIEHFQIVDSQKKMEQKLNE